MAIMGLLLDVWITINVWRVMPPHVPQMETVELDRTATELRASIPSLSHYDKLGSLLRLPSISISCVTDVWVSGAQTSRATT